MNPSRLLPKTLAIAAIAVSFVACGDDITDPQAFLDSAEAEAVLRSAAALPALPVLLQRAGDPEEAADRLALFRAQELWAAGIASDGAAARARRRLAVRYALPGLQARLAPGAWDEVDRGLRDWMATAEAMLEHIDLPRVRERLRRARALLDRAGSTADRDGRAGALLLAGSELIETTPRFVAQSLLADARAAVDRARAAAARAGEADGSDRPGAARLDRAERLKDWAGRAVESGDYLLAVQRAYYAIQLAEAI